jgi:hypothetical protein
MMAFFTICIVNTYAYTNIKTVYVCCRVLGLLEVYLQTYFLIKVRRYHPNRKSSVLNSSCGIILMLTDLIYWLQNLYNEKAIEGSLRRVFAEREILLYIKTYWFL